MELKRVVVTGIGAITPLGKNAKETWENAKNGVSGAAEITHFDPSSRHILRAKSRIITLKTISTAKKRVRWTFTSSMQ